MKECPFTPLGDRVLVEKEKNTETTASGFILPEAQGQSTHMGVVLAVGKGAMKDDGSLRPLPVKKGDRVVFGWSEKIDHDNTEYHMVSENNILAIVK